MARRREGAPAGKVESPQTVAVLREAIDALVVMLSPFAPHTAEELWHMLGHTEGLTRTAWPAFDPEIAKAEEMVVPVQVNGKLRARLTVPAEIGEEELRERALADAAQLHGWQDRQKGCRGKRAAGERGGVDDDCRLWTSSL